MSEKDDLYKEIQKNLENVCDEEMAFSEEEKNMEETTEKATEQTIKNSIEKSDRALEKKPRIEYVVEEYEEDEEDERRKKQKKNLDESEKRTRELDREDQTEKKKVRKKELDQKEPSKKEISKKELSKKESSKKESSKKEISKKEISKKEPAKRKKHHFFRNILLFLLLLVLIIAGAGYFLLRYLYRDVNYQPYETAYVRSSDVMTSPFVTNILIVGTDARNSDDASRSDCMIIASLNRKTRKVVLSSILRDSYVEIPGHGMNRINAAFQYGGPDLLIQTIETNFKVGIDHYMKVDFFSFIKIIDALGGVDIDVSGEEGYYVNVYLCEINNLLGVPQGDGNISQQGMQRLSGKQALGYSRIRYIGTDFARTGRQREVIMAAINRAKAMNPLELIKVIETAAPELTTDLSASDLSLLSLQAPLFLKGEIEDLRIPAEHTWQNAVKGPGMEVLEMDFEANRAVLQNAIYGEN